MGDYKIKLHELSEMIKDMRKHDQDIDEFSFTYASVKFRAIIDIGVTPFQLLLGAVLCNWACVLKIECGYKTSMDTSDFIRLCNILNLKPGKETFTSFAFLKFMSLHAPKKCSLTPVKPSHIMPFRKNMITDEPNKTVFWGWNYHKEDKRHARNFKKTELFFGKKVADYCRKHNISSLWTTPDRVVEKTVHYPKGFLI